MRRLEAIGCLWPGLPQLWRHGSASALLMALGFAVLLNSVLLTSYVQPELAPAWLRTVLWWVLVLGWGMSQRSRQADVNEERSPVATVGDQGLFLQAQAEYLRGHWYEAESMLQALLTATPDDIDARLLLASVLRRTGRADDARRQLCELAELSGASKWSLEIERERALLERRAEDDAEHRDDSQFGGPTALAA